MRKPFLRLLTAVILSVLLLGCSSELTDKEKIIALFYKNEDLFLSAAETGDYTVVESLRGVQSVSFNKEFQRIDFYCGGTGLVPSSVYYGICYFYDAEETFSEIFIKYPEWYADDEGGYHYRQDGGDNRFDYEPLENGFYYYCKSY